ncbi:hypothetical protein VIGAN_05189000, partial [Vigna angularis var. angularis]
EEQQQDNGYGYGGRSEYDEKPSYGSQGGVENGYGHPPQEEGYRNHCYEKHDDDDDDEGYGHKKYTVELKIRMCCTGCERVVKNAIYKFKGMSNFKSCLEFWIMYF